MEEEAKELSETKTDSPRIPQKKRERRKWELLTIKYFQLLLEYNFFRYGGKKEVLK